MVTRNSTDSSSSALASNEAGLLLDVDTDDGSSTDPNECPPSLPKCGPVPEVKEPALASPERAAPTAR